MRRPVAFAAFAIFGLSILAANAALDRWGLVPVGFGLMAPAGVYFAAIPLTARDVLQETAVRPFLAVALAIAVGVVLSVLVDPSLALASGTAFAVAECADFAVYTPLRRRAWVVAVVLSALVGSTVDAVIFLGLAAPLPLTLAGVLGLVWAKVAFSSIAAVALSPARRRLVAVV